MQVPSKDSMMDSTKTGATAGGGSALGQIMGRALLGRGVGTGVGGIVAASALDGNNRDMAAAMAIERAANELTQGSGA